MPNSLTLQAQLEASLSANQLTLLREAAVVAQGLGLSLYLVGGALRDLIMGQPLQDIDLVVEGDSALFAQALVEAACAEASQSGRHLMDVLAEKTPAPLDWAGLRDPAGYLGAADALIDRILAALPPSNAPKT